MRKTLKYIFIIIIFFLLSFFYNNYIIYNSFNPKNILVKPVIVSNFSNKYTKSYDISDLNNITKFEISERNAIDIATKKATIELDNIKSKDKYLLLNIESDYTIDRLNALVFVETTSKNYVYGANNFFSGKGNILILRNNDIKKIKIEYTKEIFENMEDDTSNVSDIKQVSINNTKDIKYIKNQILMKNIFAIAAIGLIFALLYILKSLKKYDKIGKLDIPKMFFILCITFGILFSLLFPLYQIPDELTHINMIYDELNSNITYQDIENGYGDTSRIVHDSSQKVNINKYFKFNNKFTLGKITIPEIKLIKHLPQSIGLIISSIFSLPIFFAVTLSEFLAVLFYAFVGRKTLKLMPIKKEMMMCIMLLPICIQQIGSFSYDVMLLSLSFLLIGYILNLKFEKKEINLYDILKILLLVLLIAIIKIPYCVLGLLVLILPIKKLNIKLFKLIINYDFIKKHKKVLRIILIIIFVLAIIAGIYLLKKIYFGRILLASIIYPKKYLPLLFNTLWIYKFGYIKGLASDFGWLEVKSSIVFTAFILISIFIITFINFNKKGDIEKSPFKKYETIIIYVVALILIYLIILAMFDWTAVVTGFKNLDKYSLKQIGDLMGIIPSIGGVQSRYFVPAIPLLLLPIYNTSITKKINKYNLSLFLVIYYVVIAIYMFILILYRFWI